MPIIYDGNRIYRKNNIDYNAYNDYQRIQKEKSESIIKTIDTEVSKVSWEQWLAWCPQDFKDASIVSIGEHDPDVMNQLNKAVEKSESRGYPYSVILGSEAKENPKYVRGGKEPKKIIPKGKTWAIYAYVSALYEHKIITDPVKQVKMLTEAEILDKLSEWKNEEREAWLRTIINDEVRLVIIDNISGGAGTMKRQKYGDDAWGRLVDAACKYDYKMGFVLSFSGDFKDMTLQKIKEYMYKLVNKQAVKALITNGVGSIYGSNA